MTRFWWVRHGPTHQKVFCGWRDVPADLSDQVALDRLAAILPAKALFISSDLMRAVTTADVLAMGRNRLPPDGDLREFHYGDWEGLDWQAIAGKWPDLSRACWESPGDSAPPGGESWNTAAARVDRAVARLIAAHPGEDIVVVAHAGVILTRLWQARGGDPAKVLAQAIDPLSVTRLDWDGARWTQGLINHIP